MARGLRSKHVAMQARTTRSLRVRRGFTLLELMIVVAMIGIGTGVGVPLFASFFLDLRLKGAARDAADALRLARAEAIRHGRPHLVFFSAGTGTDASGAPLPVDPKTGGPVPIVVVRDEDEDCRIDAAEPQTLLYARDGISWGTTTSGTAMAPLDTGAADHSSGSSFATPGGAAASWVAFGADGVPMPFDAVCVMGSAGDGGGALYMTSGRRDYAVVMSPLGSVRVHNWNFNGGTGAWSD
jgi:prepilin-type N-terminal cleavage/methylation domain-containing protein